MNMEKKTVAYSNLTFEFLESGLKINLGRKNFLPDLEPVAVPRQLSEQLAFNQKAIVTRSEKAVSEALVAPILMQVRQLNETKVSLFSGEPLADERLAGFCDFMFVADPEAMFPKPPVIVLVEAKKQDVMAGIPQCVAEMSVAQNLNRKAGMNYEKVFGCVTTGQE